MDFSEHEEETDGVDSSHHGGQSVCSTRVNVLGMDLQISTQLPKISDLFFCFVRGVMTLSFMPTGPDALHVDLAVLVAIFNRVVSEIVCFFSLFILTLCTDCLHRTVQKKKSVVERRPLGVAKHSATTAATAVAKSVGLGEARPLGAAKCRTAKKSKLAKSSGEFPDVAKPVGKARPPGFAKYRAATGSELAPGLAEYISSVSTSEPVELIITARKAFSHSSCINF